MVNAYPAAEVVRILPLTTRLICRWTEGEFVRLLRSITTPMSDAIDHDGRNDQWAWRLPQTR